MDLRSISASCLPRHRITQAEVVEVVPPTLNEPNFDGFPLRTLTPTDTSKIYGLMDLVRNCARRGGPAILDILSDLLQHRLLGGGPGVEAHELVDKFMTCVDACEDRAPDTSRPASPIYVNNTRDLSNKQKARAKNRGDLASQSTAFKKQQLLAAKAKQANLVLSGVSLRVDTEYLTLKKAKRMHLVDKEHVVLYMSPFTAGQPHEQEAMLERAGCGGGYRGLSGPPGLTRFHN